MKKFNTEIIIDATADELQETGITIPDYCGQAMIGWDFNTITSSGPCAKVYPYYSEDDYYEIPMRYIHFVDLTIEEANFIYPDAWEANITMMLGLSVDQHIYYAEQKYMLNMIAKVVYYEVDGLKLHAILSGTAHKYRLMENLLQELRAMGLNPVCCDEYISLVYYMPAVDQKWVIQILNRYVGFWRSIAIKTDHDRNNRMARYYINYNLITGNDLTYEQLMEAIEYVQKKI
ncbi:hypothetical protein IR083_09965 [Dysgonomonas sp. GY75]|uniref:hypothetical protein n=1 Tax=Dysgonomonas sp. GY75 TaxID=2780419 RepID=UPI001883E0CC|nr:hypothetical protein [Dysgonomonas sp. GY75]MBF0649145.1 hypothetical protein [Dysgonomonas sp. GY75]